MKLTALRLSGFRGARDEVALDIPSGFLVVVGRNGTGKSTLCDAIEFALTGEIRGASQHTEKGEGLQDYVWYRSDPPPSKRYVEVVIADETGNKYTVRRTPTDFSISPKAELEQILCHETGSLEHPIAQLCRTTILRDEEITRLSIDLKETDRFEFVQNALGTAGFASAEEKAKKVQTLIKNELDRTETQYAVSNARVAEISARLSEARSQIVDSSAITAAETALRKVLNDMPSGLNELIEKAEQELSQARLKTDQLSRLLSRVESFEQRAHQTAHEDLETQLASLSEQITTLHKQITEQGRERDAAAAELSKAEQDNPRNVSLALLREHGERLGLIDGKCPLCGSQQTDGDYQAHLAIIASTVAASNERLANLTKRSADISAQLTRLHAANSQLLAKQESFRQQQSQLDNEKAQINSEGTQLGFTLGPNGLNKNILAQRIEDYRTRVLEIERRLAVVQASKIVEQVAVLEHDLISARAEVTAVDKHITRVRTAANQIKEAFDAIRRVRGEYINEQLAQLKPLMEELFQRLRPHIDWQDFRYNLRGDVRKMLSFEVGDGLNPSFIFSSGQRRAAGLAFLLALHLSRNWCAMRTLILDDPVQHIDDYRALHLTEVLTAIRATERQIICTVEDEALGQLLARRLRIDDLSSGMIVNMAYSSEKGIHIKSSIQARPLPQQILISA